MSGRGGWCVLRGGRVAESRCRISLLRPLVALAILSVGAALPAADPAPLDLVLRGGQVHDGAGGEPRVADVGFRQGKIADVGDLAAVPADVVVDCRGLVVAPGFIDLHTHSDSAIVAPATRANVNYLLQGCTTIVTGNCGSGPVDVGSYLDKVDQFGAGTHVAHLLPQGSLRDQVMGKERRAPTPAELEKMRSLADKAMRDGAFGMSTGLIYVPGMFAETAELVEVAKVVGRNGGFYASHIRGEGSGLLDAVSEALDIGRQGGLPVHISHFKAAGRDAWGSLRVAAEKIAQARRDGQSVTADQYPYIASSTSLEATLLPSWAREGGRQELTRRLADPATAEKIRAAVEDKLRSASRIQLASYRPRRDWVGRSLEDIARQENRPAAEIVLEIERHGGAGVVNFSMQEEDVRLAMSFPWVATASDGGAKIPTADQPHPRSFGTFPRKVGRYAVAEQVLSLAQAIRSASGLPADILGLTERGYLRPGQAADVVVFDPATFRDQATFEQPYRLPTGTRYVYVAGVPAVHDGQPTGALAGRALRKTPRTRPAAAPPAGPAPSAPAPAAAARQLTEHLLTHHGRVPPFSLDFAAYQGDRNSLPIGVFDSGIGGLAVLENLLTLDRHDNTSGHPGADGIPDLAGEKFIYLGDQANMPYGNYSSAGREDLLRELILKDAIFLLGNRYWPAPTAPAPAFDKPPVKAVVIACNTATAYGLADLRAALERWQLPVPVIGVVEAGADSVVQQLPADGVADAVAVLATVGTCGSEAYPRAIARAAGQAGRRLPFVWQQGSVGLAGAIEGNPAFVPSGDLANRDYLGPAVNNRAAAIDPALVDVYAFDPAGLAGDPGRPATWQLTSVDNYVRYDVTTLVEQYRQSGGARPIRQVVLGCTHYPYEAARISATLQRLRDYRDSAGRQPYRALLADSIELIDPGVLTATQLYLRLRRDRLLVPDSAARHPSVQRLYLSVPAPAGEGTAGPPAAALAADGAFTTQYKYGRTAGRFDVEDARVVPLDATLLPASARQLLERHCPRVWQSLP